MEEDNGEVYDDLEDVEVVYLNDSEIEDVEEDPINDDENEDITVEANIPDSAKLTFIKHGQSVFIGVLNKDGSLAATGGQDDMAYVWSAETGEVLLECTGHKDSVTQVAFNFDEQYVATGDLQGLVQVWSLKDKKLLWCFETDDMEWLTWHHLANVLFAGTRSGEIYIWQIPSGNCKVLASHGASTTCGNLLPDGKRLLAGYNDGKIILWDIKTATALWQIEETSKIDESGILSLEVTSDSSLFIAAPTGNVFKVADGRQTGSLLTTDQENLEVAAINDESGLVATGSLSGKFCVWDLKKNSTRHVADLNVTITTLKWGPQERLFVGAGDGCVYVCDAKSGTLIQALTGHRNDVFSLSLSKDGSTVLSTSDDGTAKVFSLKTE